MRKQGGAWTRETTDFYNTKLVLRTEKISFPSFLGTLFNSELCRGGKQKDPPRARKQRYNLFICDLKKEFQQVPVETWQSESGRGATRGPTLRCCGPCVPNVAGGRTPGEGRPTQGPGAGVAFSAASSPATSFFSTAYTTWQPWLRSTPRQAPRLRRCGRGPTRGRQRGAWKSGRRDGRWGNGCREKMGQVLEMLGEILWTEKEKTAGPVV